MPDWNRDYASILETEFSRCPCAIHTYHDYPSLYFRSLCQKACVTNNLISWGGAFE